MLLGQCAGGALDMLHVLHGGDEFALRDRLARIVEVNLEPGMQPSIIFDGVSVSWTLLRDSIGAKSLFAARHVVVVRDLLATWGGKAETSTGAGRPPASEFAAYMSKLPEDTDVVLVEGELSASNRYLKALAGIGPELASIVEQSVPKDHGQRMTWSTHKIRGMVLAGGGKIEADALHNLVVRCGADLRLAEQEVHKLLAYTAPKCAIHAIDVDVLMPFVQENSAYALIDAIAARQAPLTVDLAERLLAAGQAPEQILALAASRIHDLVLLSAAHVEGIPQSTVAERAGWPPWRLRQLSQTLNAFSGRQLHDAQSMLVSADLALKSRPSHERPLLMTLALLGIARRSSAQELADAFAF